MLLSIVTANEPITPRITPTIGARLTLKNDWTHRACLAQGWLEDIMTFAKAGDRDSQMAYLKKGYCELLPEGTTATYMATSYRAIPANGWDAMQIAIDGTTYWISEDSLRH